MIGPLLDSLPIEQVKTYWEADGEFPDHEPNPLLPENREFIIEKDCEKVAVAQAPGARQDLGPRMRLGHPDPVAQRQ
jgi:hypothetical protein